MMTLLDAFAKLDEVDFRVKGRTRHKASDIAAITACELEAYRKSTERCRRFLDCVQRYVDVKTKESIRTIGKEAKDAGGKAKAARRADG